MAGTVQDKIADSYLAKFDRPLSVSGMQKLRKFPMLQQLGYNGQLSHMKKDFHGLKEFNVHMNMYSSTHPILTAAWNVIKNIAPKNPFIEALMFTSSSLGKVGKFFQTIAGFGRVFALNADQVISPDKAAASIPGGGQAGE